MDGRYQILQRLNDSQTCFLGVCAGCIEAASTQPLTYAKNCLQQGIRLSLDPRIVYRGTGASCLADGSLIGVQFLVCGKLQQQMSEELTFGEELGCALAAGATSGLPCCVLELTMIQQQRFGKNALRTVSSIVRDYGWSGMLRGIGPSVARESLFAAGYLGLSPQLDKFFHAQQSSFATAASSLISGLLCAALTHPIDTIKSCMQGDMRRNTYGDTLQTARVIYGDGGMAPFFRGYGARAVLICLCFYIFSETKLQLGQLLFAGRLLVDRAKSND